MNQLQVESFFALSFQPALFQQSTIETLRLSSFLSIKKLNETFRAFLSLMISLFGDAQRGSKEKLNKVKTQPEAKTLQTECFSMNEMLLTHREREELEYEFAFCILNCFHPRRTCCGKRTSNQFTQLF